MPYYYFASSHLIRILILPANLSMEVLKKLSCMYNGEVIKGPAVITLGRLALSSFNVSMTILSRRFNCVQHIMISPVAAFFFLFFFSLCWHMYMTNTTTFLVSQCWCFEHWYLRLGNWCIQWCEFKFALLHLFPAFDPDFLSLLCSMYVVENFFQKLTIIRCFHWMESRPDVYATVSVWIISADHLVVFWSCRYSLGVYGLWCYVLWLLGHSILISF